MSKVVAWRCLGLSGGPYHQWSATPRAQCHIIITTKSTTLEVTYFSENLFDYTKKTSCSELEPRHGRVIMSKENRKPPSGVGERETIENLRVFLIC